MFDLNLLEEYASKQCLTAHRKEENIVAVDVGTNLLLCFENWPDENDTCIYFDGSDEHWHSHGSLYANETVDIASVPMSIIQEMLEGSLLISTTEFPNGETFVGLDDGTGPYPLTPVAGETVSLFRMSSQDSDVFVPD